MKKAEYLDLYFDKHISPNDLNLKLKCEGNKSILCIKILNIDSECCINGKIIKTSLIKIVFKNNILVYGINIKKELHTLLEKMNGFIVKICIHENSKKKMSKYLKILQNRIRIIRVMFDISNLKLIKNYLPNSTTSIIYKYTMLTNTNISRYLENLPNKLNNLEIMYILFGNVKRNIAFKKLPYKLKKIISNAMISNDEIKLHLKVDNFKIHRGKKNLFNLSTNLFM